MWRRENLRGGGREFIAIKQLMTVICMMFLVLFIISLVFVLDQLQSKNLMKQRYLSKKSKIKENA
jgi:uncharacterized BrkB/YihY/UPF0761 family membrane protein